MKKEVIVCDTCEAQTFDIYAETSWYALGGTPGGGSINITKCNGRNNNGSSTHKGVPVIKHRPQHFCSKSCLEQYFKKVLEF